MFEMLGIYDDSLLQYDELDALFTQFLLNHAAGGKFSSVTFNLNLQIIVSSAFQNR